jgi:hypothetical protein
LTAVGFGGYSEWAVSMSDTETPINRAACAQATLDEAMLEAVADEFDGWSRQVVGSSGWEVYDSRGVLLDWGIDAPEALSEDLRAQVEQMSATPHDPARANRWVWAPSGTRGAQTSLAVGPSLPTVVLTPAGTPH